MKKLVSLILLCGAMPFSAIADSVDVVVSVKPIQFIVNEITLGVTEPDLLVSSNASPHDYALKPSDVKKVNKADLVIWFGPELEPFLTGVLKDKEQSFRLDKQKALTLIEFGEEHEDHHGHDHGTHDPHVWLGPVQAKQIARIVADKLSEIDASNHQVYEGNYKKFVTELNKTVSRIEQQLQPVQHKGYYVFHDAYGYFEKYFGLNRLGEFTVSPERKPGAKTLIKIRTALRSGEVKCVFSEPQFKPAIIESVTRGSDVDKGELDPLGTDIPLESSSYFNFLLGLSDSFYQCLSSE